MAKKLDSGEMKKLLGVKEGEDLPRVNPLKKLFSGRKDYVPFAQRYNLQDFDPEYEYLYEFLERTGQGIKENLEGWSDDRDSKELYPLEEHLLATKQITKKEWRQIRGETSLGDNLSNLVSSAKKGIGDLVEQVKQEEGYKQEDREPEEDELAIEVEVPKEDYETIDDTPREDEGDIYGEQMDLPPSVNEEKESNGDYIEFEEIPEEEGKEERLEDEEESLFEELRGEAEDRKEEPNRETKTYNWKRERALKKRNRNGGWYIVFGALASDLLLNIMGSSLYVMNPESQENYPVKEPIAIEKKAKEPVYVEEKADEKTSFGLWDRVSGDAREKYENALAKRDSLRDVQERNQRRIDVGNEKTAELGTFVESRRDSFETLQEKLDDVRRYEGSLIKKYTEK